MDKNFKRLKTSYASNAIFMCISLDGKFFWFPGRKCWYQQNSKGILRDS